MAHKRRTHQLRRTQQLQPHLGASSWLDHEGKHDLSWFAAAGLGTIVVAFGIKLLASTIIYGDWLCAFRRCVVPPGWSKP